MKIWIKESCEEVGFVNLFGKMFIYAICELWVDLRKT